MSAETQTVDGMNLNESVHSEFVNRVASLPTVEAALGVAAASYNKVKEASPGLFQSAFSGAEATTNFALEHSQPILRKLSKPIMYVDSLACMGLDKVEEKIPAVKNAPEQIISDVKDFGVGKVNSVKDFGVGKVNSVKDYSVDTVNSVKDYGTAKLQQIGLGTVVPNGEKITEYKEQLVTYATAALAATEGVLDNHISSLGGQLPEANGATNGDLKLRMESLTTKAKICLNHHTASRFVTVQKYASDGLGRVVEALDVVRALKTGVAEGKSVQEISETLKFAWLSKLLEEAKDQPATQQALFVAQAAAKEAQDAIVQARDGIKNKVSDAYFKLTSLAGEFTSNLTSVDASSLTTALITRFHEQATQLQSLIQQVTGLNLTHYLPEIISKADVPALANSNGNHNAPAALDSSITSNGTSTHNESISDNSIDEPSEDDH